MAERSTRGASGIGAGVTESGLSPGTATPQPISAGRGARTARDIFEAGREQAIDEAKAVVREVTDKQRFRAAETVGGVAQALHRAAGNLDAENETMARYTHMAAERLDDIARTLRQGNWGDMVAGAESFARRQPYWFIGGAVAAGFLVSRFIKSAPTTRRLPSAGPHYGTATTTPYGTAATPQHGGAASATYGQPGTGELQ